MEVMIDGVRYVQAQQDEIALSVLIPSVGSRRASFAPKIMEALFGQHERLSPEAQRRVEILTLMDAGRSGGMLVGDKRNAMVRMARGQYVVFVDDDDRVESDYLETLLEATKNGADCITFNAMVSLNGAAPKLCKYSIEYERDADSPTHYQRLPNHITAVKRVLALACPFPSKQCGEDAEYAVRLRPTLKTAWRIERALYHYDFNQATTETQRPELKLVTPPSPAATVDVVILSKATTPELIAMAETAMRTCREGARGHVVNILIMEQVDGVRYVHADRVMYAPEQFNYNQFANRGATNGAAPWIMVANSDLVFEDGWLDALLNANRECVSPVDPTGRKQKDVRRDEAGWENGRHFSGWCFMITRKLWQKIGGFDDCVRYWCSDDVVIEQCRIAGVMPMVVAAARVKHLVSATAKNPDDDDTWGQVAIFNKKYPRRKLFHSDARYLNYCRKNGLAA